MYIRAYENNLKDRVKQNQSANMFMITTARSNFRAIAKHRALEKINSQIKNNNLQGNVSARIYNQSFYQLEVSPTNKPSKHELRQLPSSPSRDKLSRSINLYHSQELTNQRAKKIKKMIKNSYISRPISVQCRLVRKESISHQYQNQNYFESKPQFVLDLSKTLRKQHTPDVKNHRMRIKRNQSLNPEVQENKQIKRSKNNRSFIVKNIIKQIDKQIPNKSIFNKQKGKDENFSETLLLQRIVNTQIQKLNPWVVKKQPEDWEQF